MKRTWIAGLAAVMILSSLSACGEPKSVKADANETPAAASGTHETPTPTAADTPEPSQTEEKIEVTLSNSQDLTEDYTTMHNIIVQPGTYIAVVAKGLDSNYWKAVKKGAQTAIRELNAVLGYTGSAKVRMTFEGPGNNADVDAQINMIDAVLAENPTVLCLSAIDMQSCDAQLETAAENGIPVVVIDSGVQNNLVSVACATNNFTAGAEAARKLSEAIGGSGEVAVMAHQQTAQSSIDRVAGFVDEIAKNHPNVKIVETNYENEDQRVEELVEAVLEAHPDLAGYFATNEAMSNKTLRILENSENGQVKVVGFDAGETQQKAVREGTEYGMISQNPYGMGYASMVAAARLAARLPADSYISSGYQWIDSSNIDLQENQKYLYN